MDLISKLGVKTCRKWYRFTESVSKQYLEGIFGRFRTYDVYENALMRK